MAALVWPHDALPDVEAANQRAYSTNMQAVAQSAQRGIDQAAFISAQEQLAHLQANQFFSLNAELMNSILQARSSRDQPNVSPSIAFVPPPGATPAPGAVSATGTPAVTPATKS